LGYYLTLDLYLEINYNNIIRDKEIDDMATPKALKEIETLKLKIKALEEAYAANRKQLMDPINGRNNIIFQAFVKEGNSLYSKKDKAERKLESLKDWGISTSEQAQLKKNASRELKSLYVDNKFSLGCRSREYTGYYKPLDSYIHVGITRWTGFMSNVRGCGSLANTSDLNWVKFITEDESKELLNNKQVNA
jgi:hypothetical protein